MVKDGDKLKLGDVEFEVHFVSKMEGPPHLLHVVDTGLERHYLFSMPVAMWEAAVRGATPSPSDEELVRLKAEHEAYTWEIDGREKAARNYIEALERQLSELRIHSTRFAARIQRLLTKIRGLARGAVSMGCVRHDEGHLIVAMRRLFEEICEDATLEDEDERQSTALADDDKEYLEKLKGEIPDGQASPL